MHADTGFPINVQMDGRIFVCSKCPITSEFFYLIAIRNELHLKF